MRKIEYMGNAASTIGRTVRTRNIAKAAPAERARANASRSASRNVSEPPCHEAHAGRERSSEGTSFSVAPPPEGLFAPVSIVAAALKRQSGQVAAVSVCGALSALWLRLTKAVAIRGAAVPPNTSFKRTVTGRPALALISFWAKAVLPAPAA